MGQNGVGVARAIAPPLLTDFEPGQVLLPSCPYLTACDVELVSLQSLLEGKQVGHPQNLEKWQLSLTGFTAWCLCIHVCAAALSLAILMYVSLLP